MDPLYAVQQSSQSLSLQAQSSFNLITQLIARLYSLRLHKVMGAIIQLVDGENGQMRKVTLAEVAVTKTVGKNVEATSLSADHYGNKVTPLIRRSAGTGDQH